MLRAPKARGTSFMPGSRAASVSAPGSSTSSTSSLASSAAAPMTSTSSTATGGIMAVPAPPASASSLLPSASSYDPGCAYVPTDSRQGRARQRYGENGERLVAGCIPVKFVDDGNGATRVEVCMITTRGGNGLVFPKGGWENDETLDCAARRETVEEAGVRGILEEPMLGEFSFSSAKAQTRRNSLESGVKGTNPTGQCRAFMFVMRVQEELGAWPESNDRQRVWCGPSEASRQCKHEWMRAALNILMQRLVSSNVVPAPA